MADATLAFNILTKYRDTGANKAAKDLDNLGKSGTRMGSSLKRAAAVGAVALAGGVVLAGKALVGMTKSAIDDEAAQKRLALALKNNAGATKGQVSAVESWITAQGKAYGVTDDELRPALMKLVGATHDVGKAQKLASLAMDISAGTGKSLGVVTQALMKAQNGQVAGLSKLGIKTQDSAKDTVALQAADIALTKAQHDYTKAVHDHGAKSDEAQAAAAKLELAQTKLGQAQEKSKKTTIDFDEAQKRLADTFGGQAAKQADTLQGRMNRLKVQYDETKEAIGYRLIPVVLKLADVFTNQILPGIGRTTTFLGKHKNMLIAAGIAVGVLTTGVLTYNAAAFIAGVTTKTWTVVTKAAAGAQAIYNGVLAISRSYLATWVGVKALELGAWVRSTAATIASTAALLANKVVYGASYLRTFVAVKALEFAAWVKSTAATVANTTVLLANKAVHGAAYLRTFIAVKALEFAAWVKTSAATVASTAVMVAHTAATKTVAAATKTYTAVQWLLNAAWAANPIGVVVLGLVALGAALVVAYRKSETFRNIVNGALNAVKAVAKTVFGAITGFANTTFDWLKGHWPLLLGILTGPVGLAVVVIAKHFGQIKEGIRTAFEGIREIVRNSTGAVVDKVLWMAEKVLGAAVSAFGWAPGIGDKLKAARDKVHAFRDHINDELGGIHDKSVAVTVKAGVTSTAGLGLHGGPGTGLAEGGPVTGGVQGKDSVAAWLMPGEHVLTTEEVKKAGGHGAVKAIRRMLKRGEFKKRGDVPAFAQGGPVFAASTHSSNLSKPIAKLRDRTAETAAHQVAAWVQAELKRMGGEGKLTPAQIARGQAFAKAQVGEPYTWGGVGPYGFDCSGFVGAVLNAALGKNPYSRRGTTGTMPWAGFSPGKGSFSAGWFTGNPGHMAGRIGGMGIESAGGVGARVGGNARSVDSFPNVAHYDQGGWLQPGWTAAYNGTGKPEKVMSGRSGDSGSDLLGVVEVVVRTEDGREIQRKLLEVKRKSGRDLGLG